MTALVDVRNLIKVYHPGEHEIRALNDISITIGRGEFAAIVGQSGSGKSTLMNMLGCLDIPTSGTYYLDGTDISKLTDNQLAEIRSREIGFIFQGFHLIPTLDALENVELPLLYRGMGKQQRHKLAYNALCRVGLRERLHHRPGQMSGGQQQRVAIARAIASSPPVILADEPTGNLDSQSGRDVMDIMEHLREEGHTVILITHDEAIAGEADRIIRISDGKIIGDSRKAG